MEDDSGAQATRDALQRIEDDGSDLSMPLSMDFFVAVPTANAGESVAREAERLGYKTSVEQSDSGDWTCYCTKTIVASFEAVRGAESELDELGRRFGGYADGFGTFGNAN